MFGKRGASAEVAQQPQAEPAASPAAKQKSAPPKPAAGLPPVATAQGAKAGPPPKVETAQRAPQPSAIVPVTVDNRSDDYYQVKTMIFSALIDTIDLGQLAQLDADSAREEIRDIVNEIISIKSAA